MNDEKGQVIGDEKKSNYADSVPTIDTVLAHRVASKVIWVVRTSVLVSQASDRERRLKVRKVLNDAMAKGVAEK